MNNLKILLLVLIFLFLTTITNAQSIGFVEQASKVSTIKDQVSAKEALLVFESKFDIEFESSMEKLRKPLRIGNMYKVFVTQKTCVISIREIKSNSHVKIDFGQLTQNSFPTLKNGEIRYFQLKLEDRLEVVNQTEDLKAKFSDNQMQYEKEALIIINCNPSDLELEFNSTEPITDKKKDKDNRYLLYVKPLNQTITINHKESGAYEALVLRNLEVKEVRYFYVILPDYLRVSANQSVGIQVTFKMNQSDVYISIGDRAPVLSFGSSTVYSVPAGEHTFRFIKNGFNEDVRKIDVQEAQTIEVNLSPGTVTTPLPLSGWINVTSEPIGVDVYLNEQRVGVTPYQGKQIAGNYNLMLRYPLFYDHVLQFKMNEGATINLPTVKMKPRFGYWQLTSSPPGAEVYIDKKLMGKTPITRTEISSGEHTLKITKESYHEHNEGFTISDGDDKKFNIQLKEAFGKMEINTDPSGASIFINGQRVGTTPYENPQQASGKYDLMLTKDLYHDYKESFTISDGYNKIISTQLKEAFGKMKISSDPSGAKVFIEGIEVGVTPYENLQQPSGTLNIRLKKDLYSDTREQVVVSDGQLTEKFIPLSRNFGSLKVKASEADIYIDNIKVGSGSYTANLAPGQYKVKASRYLYNDDEREVFIILGQTEDINLTPRPRQGALSISSKPFETNGAEIHINGIKRSETTPATIPLLMGNYSVTIKKQGYLDVTQSAEVKEGREQDLLFNLQTFQGSMKQKANQYKTAKTLYGMATLAVVGTGAYFRYSAMMLGDEYKTATTNASSVYDKFEQHDLYSYIAIGAAVPLGVMTVVKMTQQKKAQRKMNLAVLPYVDGTMFYLSWKF